MREFELILCERCNNFDFPESDEDSFLSVGCKHPKVIDVFQNFYRKYKCKYYKQISYYRLLKEVKGRLASIDNFSYHCRDKKYKRKTTVMKIRGLNRKIHLYLKLKEYLEKEFMTIDAIKMKISISINQSK